MRYWFDTEFDERSSIIHLISVGIVAEDGREYYAINSEYDSSCASDWLRQNVLQHLNFSQAKSRTAIRQEVLDFFSPAPSEIWAYFGEYDWVVLRQLLGHMLDWPQAWPLSHMNLEQFRLQSGGPSLPAQQSSVHHALHDARWCREAWQFLQKRPG
ncbi:MAG: 3'-5' exoribonuclease [Candidatus Accumulibacter meliphilus]|jgi:hypothetical protein|uniref:3'-5' exoribonuclease domain-containing protein n=1 Tax=Candidatus Accumulibacter meliphilus TaxID=2211374 RepID=UPI002FC30AEB